MRNIAYYIRQMEKGVTLEERQRTADTTGKLTEETSSTVLAFYEQVGPPVHKGDS